MRTVVQRVLHAAVSVAGNETGSIGQGLCCLVGIEAGDGIKDIEYTASKISTLRIFDDEHGTMNHDVSAIGGGILLVSQFTLLGDVRKGRRPSYSQAEKPEQAKIIFENLVTHMRQNFSGTIATGIFQAEMEVSIVNNGPVTILLDSRKLF